MDNLYKAKEVYFMPNQFFMVKFEAEEVRNDILKSVWKFGEAFVYVMKWSPNFDPKMMEPTHGPLWIQLYYLPFEFWSEESLRKIGNNQGQILNFDMGEDDTTHYVRTQIIWVVKIPNVIKLRTKWGIWNQKN
ncbi:hypothetical protein SUGI_0217120 [Cryptomeria japonica]|nr:hypothetical protein SUGI_0217120 [Cryptomeria japonica]